MNILTIGSPKTFESEKIVEAAVERGHNAHSISLHDIYFEIKNNKFSALHNEYNLLDFDAFIFRGISSSIPQKSQLYNALILAKYLYDNNKIVIDKKLATKSYIASKIEYSLAKCNIPTPNTVLTLGRSSTKKYLNNADFPLIIKAVNGSKGRGVFLAHDKIEALDILNKNESKKFLFQEYIPSRFDIRVFVVGNRVLGAMRRDAAENDFRSNIAQGGTSSVFDLSNNKAIETLAIEASKASSCDIAGVDIMIDSDKLYVLEVNRAPQFKGFFKSTGINVGEEIIKFVETQFV